MAATAPTPQKCGMQGKRRWRTGKRKGTDKEEAKDIIFTMFSITKQQKACPSSGLGVYSTGVSVVNPCKAGYPASAASGECKM